MLPQSLYEAVTHGVGLERPFLCAVHQDTRPSAYVNVVKMLWYCQTCGAHGNVEGEALAADPDFRLVRRYIDDVTAETRTYREAWLNQYDAGGPGDYWSSRFTQEACRHFRLGQDLATGMPCYPLRSPSGDVLGIVTRPGENKGPKYKYPYGVDIGTLLFNFSYSWLPEVVLVEGAADAIAMWEAGIQAIAIYGSRLSADQAHLLRQIDPSRVICAFDNDTAGWEAFANARKVLAGMTVVRATWPKAWGKDPGELSIEHRKEVIERLAYDDAHRIESPTCSSPRTTPKILSIDWQPPSWPSSPRRMSTKQHEPLLHTGS